MTAKKKNSEPSFEEELARLEALANRMEAGELPLDRLMDAYEEGEKLSKALQARLDTAKARLNEVKEDKNGNLSAIPSGVAVQSSLLDDADDDQ